jgi:acyl-CoA synthetase (AMP-forming)/AMP-acid ligase II
VIYSHPDILEAAVIGVPDAQWGEAAKAVVVLKTGSSMQAEDLMAFCKARLAGYKVPKSVEFQNALPHTDVGKVNKVKLKEILLRGAGAAIYANWLR